MIRRLSPLMLMLLLAGCAVGPDYQQPAPQTPTHWNDPGDGGVKSQTASTAMSNRSTSPGARHWPLSLMTGAF